MSVRIISTTSNIPARVFTQKCLIHNVAILLYRRITGYVELQVLCQHKLSMFTHACLSSSAYRSQRGRGHVTAILSCVPSKIQIRQWFVTNYAVWISLCILKILAYMNLPGAYLHALFSFKSL